VHCVPRRSQGTSANAHPKKLWQLLVFLTSATVHPRLRKVLHWLAELVESYAQLRGPKVKVIAVQAISVQMNQFFDVS
jgi:hypothetical protein